MRPWPQPRDLESFDALQARCQNLASGAPLGCACRWRILRFPFGRAADRGRAAMDWLARVLSRLEAIHAEQPLDLVLITGDETDAGRSSEWAEFMTALERHPRAGRARPDPARQPRHQRRRSRQPSPPELPTSPTALLRKLRTPSAIDEVQGDRVHVVDRTTSQLGGNLPLCCRRTSQGHRAFRRISGHCACRWSWRSVWAEVFPIVLPPDTEDGLGVAVLNSTAETHFPSQTRWVSCRGEQVQALIAVAEQFPRARWILALHHHSRRVPASGSQAVRCA